MMDIYSFKQVLKGKSKCKCSKEPFWLKIEGRNILAIGSARAKEFCKYIFSRRWNYILLQYKRDNLSEENKTKEVWKRQPENVS